MVATDGSEGADRAVDVAAELAKALGGSLSIVTIGGSLSADEIRQLERANETIGDVLDALSTRTLMAARERASRNGLAAIEVHAGWGDPAETIIEIARRDHIDAIVLGRRGRGRLAGLLLGSVSQKIVSLAPCAVIVVP
ncbi:MAG: universal stress protein [Xanthobacteraceae bacterium]|nr:universal stress protein [Xanthobacteraceae bacterium]